VGIFQNFTNNNNSCFHVTAKIQCTKISEVFITQTVTLEYHYWFCWNSAQYQLMQLAPSSLQHMHILTIFPQAVDQISSDFLSKLKISPSWANVYDFVHFLLAQNEFEFVGSFSNYQFPVTLCLWYLCYVASILSTYGCSDCDQLAAELQHSNTQERPAIADKPRATLAKIMPVLSLIWKCEEYRLLVWCVPNNMLLNQGISGFA